MSADDWEVFRQMRAKRQDQRRKALLNAEPRVIEVHTLCNRIRLWMKINNHSTHWNFGRLGSDKTRISYWPSSKKLQRHPGIRVQQNVSVDQLMQILRDISDQF